MFKKQQLKQEILKRAEKKNQDSLKPMFVLEDNCFKPQLDFIQDTSKFKIACCSRRAGKSTGIAHDLTGDAQLYPGVNLLYITRTRDMAEKIMWSELLKLNEDYELGGKPNYNKLKITFPNRTTIYLSGCNVESDADKFRGPSYKKIYVDEAQFFPPFLSILIDEVLAPALIDYNGSLILTGTPNASCSGIFYDACHNPEGWSKHHWTMFENPWLEKKSGIKTDIIVDLELKRLGIDKTHPKYLREYAGIWTYDASSLVYKYDPNKNHYNEVESDLQYVLGCDIGYVDSDAIAILGYSLKTTNVYLIEEHIKSKQNITELINQIKYLQDKYKPVKMVMDAGALGKKIQEEIRFRHAMNLEAAEKHRKFEFIELLNDDFGTGKLMAKKDSRFADDCRLLQWDRTRPEHPKISNAFHSDITDAVLYAWRECKHYLEKEVERHILPNTDAWMEKYWEDESEKMEMSKDGNSDIWGNEDVSDLWD